MPSYPVIELDVSSLVDDYRRGVSAVDLSKRYQCSVNTVLRRLRSAKVSVRTPKESHPCRKLDITGGERDTLVTIIDGILLGDGYVSIGGSIQLGQCRRRVGWLRQVQSLLAAAGLTSKIIVTKKSSPSIIRGRSVKRSGGYLLYTPHCMDLREQRARWYPTGRKIVPKDVKITALSLALWFSGDGSYDRTGTLTFSTQGFRCSDVDLLLRKLREHGIEGRRYPGPFIKINRRDDACKIAQLVKPYIPRCMRYKLRYVRRAIPRGRALRLLSENQVRSIRKLRAGGLSGSVLADRFGVSNVTIYNIEQEKIYKNVI